MYLSTSRSLLMHATWSSHTSRTFSRKSCPAAAEAMLDPLPEGSEEDGGKLGTIARAVSRSRCALMRSATEL